MKIFLDTASVKDIREAAALGVLDGVTTNPTLLSKEKADPEEVLVQICEIVKGPVSAEVVATDAEGMVREGRHWAGVHKNIVVKCPCTVEGLKATRALSDAGIRINMTLVFSATQALLAAKAGASFISPFIGRIDDTSHEGMHLIEQIITIYQNYGFYTEVLVASVRSPVHVLEAAQLGADICTIPLKVIEQLFYHPLTDIGLKKFIEDGKKIPV